MGKHETDGWDGRQRKLIHNGYKIAAIGSQAMHPDDRTSRMRGCFQLDGREQIAGTGNHERK
jgi:hypothetical protein